MSTEDGPCDAPNATMSVTGGCRCLICARCHRHTGNSHQGHYWALCKKTKRVEKFHFCCPDLECDLDHEAARSEG